MIRSLAYRVVASVDRLLISLRRGDKNDARPGEVTGAHDRVGAHYDTGEHRLTGAPEGRHLRSEDADDDSGEGAVSWREAREQLTSREWWSEASGNVRQVFGTRITLRGRVVLSLFAVVALIGVADRYTGESEPPLVATETGGPAALSSAWYCPLIPATRANPQAGGLVVLNPTDTVLTGTVAYFPVGGPLLEVPLDVAPRQRVELRPGDALDASYSAALVRLNGGGAAVEHFVAGPQGPVAAPCAPAASSRWFVPDGTTEADTTMLLGLFNPFLEDAVADLDFVTSEGRAAPGDFQGVVVPARQLLIVNVSESLRRRSWISATVETRRGRLVVDQLQLATVNGATSLALTPATAEAAQQWFLPNLNSGSGPVGDRLSIYNPGRQEARLLLELTGDGGALEPFELFVPAEGRTGFDLGSQERVPRGAVYSAVLRSLNDQPFVVSRAAALVETDALTGTVLENGVVLPARRWAMVYGRTDDPVDEIAHIFNPGDVAAQVRVGVTGDGGFRPTGAPLTVQPGGRAVVRVDELAATTIANPSVFFDADEPVIVSRDFRVGDAVVSAGSAVRLG